MGVPMGSCVRKEGFVWLRVYVSQASWMTNVHCMIWLDAVEEDRSLISGLDVHI
jgi:hypothetical protein